MSTTRNMSTIPAWPKMRLPTLSQTLVILLYQVAEDEDDEERVCWGGGNLHQLKVSTSATKWERLVTASSIQRRSIFYLFLAGFQEGGGHEIKPCEQQVEYVFASV